MEKQYIFRGSNSVIFIIDFLLNMGNTKSKEFAHVEMFLRACPSLKGQRRLEEQGRGYLPAEW